MNEFLCNAERILDAAGKLKRAGQSPSSMVILIGWSGAIHLVTDSEWPLDSLQMHHGARLAYRVSEHQDRVRVEGRSGSESCVLESGAPAVLPHILGGRPARGEPHVPALLPAGKFVSTAL